MYRFNYTAAGRLSALNGSRNNVSGGSTDIDPEPEGKQNGTDPLQNIVIGKGLSRLSSAKSKSQAITHEDLFRCKVTAFSKSLPNFWALQGLQREFIWRRKKDSVNLQRFEQRSALQHRVTFDLEDSCICKLFGGVPSNRNGRLLISKWCGDVTALISLLSSGCRSTWGQSLLHL